ncbi:tryptophan--tRNA ligase [Candidatus Shapirobacteria bacterium CG09_land_8_20_14_0_10_38_17]|uniref:Tryptophan--tRNA ligase n=1 Tax=Candidatus Shapirobacteria bacterium CG09_land_8_20_14_0_10_38_17 TaxID=1974884 RepID=A0A2H0WT52_9BACT|nr:MAG: tryptophan--tRNA ligase [Candidatus Shapirobacteria bacterium CG09_land_8_20_14_0_10_38_17]
MDKKRILTGDRPTGKLHLGHYVGTLANRVRLQDKYNCFFIIADLHVLTTKTGKKEIGQINKNVRHLILDYLSVGIDPKKSVIYRQSRVPEVAYLSLLFSMLVTVPRCQRVPTLKEVMHDLKITKPSLGLLTYPVLQAADILMVKAHLVPVGKDQESHIELTREIAHKFNEMYGRVFPEPKTLIGEVPTLPGLDGKAKMSKSLGNCIYLSDSEKEVKEKVMGMYTDPTRIHSTDPGHIKGNPVFIYHNAFNQDKEEVEELKKHYQAGEVGDVEVKERLAKAINVFLDPIRFRRAKFEKEKNLVEKILEKGNQKARQEAQKTLGEVKEKMGLE